MRLKPEVSVVTPAFNEDRNLAELYARLAPTLDAAGVSWEWIIVDDHSPGGTYAAAEALHRRDGRVHAIRLSRNGGSHAAIRCGLRHARGKCAIVLAGDLQDPPEVAAALLARWREGAQVVWARRARRHGEKVSTLGFAGVYYWMMRRVIGIREMPAGGADFFLVDRRVMDALNLFPETHVSVLALLSWLGFKQAVIDYEKGPRLHGRSGWTFEKKLKLFIDSITSFSYLPIRAMSMIGFCVALLGFAYAAFVVYNAFSGQPPAGWSSLMVVVLVVSGLQMLMFGVLGEYLWRALDEARQRPGFLIEETTLPADAAASSKERAR